MTLGSLIIQKRFQYFDRELVEQITENPYLQYFIGLPGCQDEPSFDASVRVLFRKRLDVDAIMEANAYMFHDDNDNNTPPSSDGTSAADNLKAENKGTLIVDATCAPIITRYPQDISLLNEVREKLEVIISAFVKYTGLHLQGGML